MQGSGFVHPLLLVEPTPRCARQYESAIGLPCRIVETVGQAKRALAATRAWSAVLTELRLRRGFGELGGIELVRSVRRRHPGMPVMVVSGCKDAETLVANELPDVPVLCKPPDEDLLRSWTRHWAANPWLEEEPGCSTQPMAKLQWVAAYHRLTSAATRALQARMESGTVREAVATLELKPKAFESLMRQVADRTGMTPAVLVKRLLDPRIRAGAVIRAQRVSGTVRKAGRRAPDAGTGTSG